MATKKTSRKTTARKSTAKPVASKTTRKKATGASASSGSASTRSGAGKPAAGKPAAGKASAGKAPAGKTAAGKTGSGRTASSQSGATRSSRQDRAQRAPAAATWTPPAGPVVVEREIGGRTLSLETGRMARLADAAIVARYGDTMVLATAQAAPQDRDDIDFLPLTVDYREKSAAAGKFPGGFFKREGRPTTREILTCRIIDRSIRPLFADGFRRETQVLSQVLATDKENDSDVLAAVASFAALAISSIPSGKTLGGCRIGLVDGKLKINPTWSDLQGTENRLNLMVSAHRDAILMVEAGADQLPEEVLLEALELAHDVCAEIADMIDELVEKVGKPKLEIAPPTLDEELAAEIRAEFGEEILAAPLAGGHKHLRGTAKQSIKAAVREAFPAPEDADDKGIAGHRKKVSAILESMFKEGERRSVLAGRRADGRGHADIRDISIEIGVLPRVHGSALFTRGETQALCTATLGTVEDQQFIDGIYPEERRRWLLHYDFPPFCVGEVRRAGGPGRREIGHGALAERAVAAVLPPRDQFAYTLRVTSEVLESNGSSSMASVCGATLALMDAGVPIAQPVAGIAMGLVVEGDEVAILSDILGSEDHCGDMDFKVAGTGKGITALQMDIKCEGLARETLEQALEQARQGRLHILREMLKVIRKPRADVSRNAPRLVSFTVPLDKIGGIIGPGGRTIRAMQDEFQCRIAVLDAGAIEISGGDAERVDACIQRIKDMTAEIEVGKVYKGRVTGVKEFGAFVEILPGQEGLVHVSELSNTFIRTVTDAVQMGEEIEVKVIDIDDFGKVKLSRRALLPPGEDQAGGEGGPSRSRDRGPERDGGRRGRDDRGREDRDERRGRRAEPRDEVEPDFDDEVPAEVDADVEVDIEFEPVVEVDPDAESRPVGRRDRGRGRGDSAGRDAFPSRGPREPRADREPRPSRGPRPERSPRLEREPRPEREPRGEREPRPEREARGGREPRAFGTDPEFRDDRGPRGRRRDADDVVRPARDDDREPRRSRRDEVSGFDDDRPRGRAVRDPDAGARRPGRGRPEEGRDDVPSRRDERPLRSERPAREDRHPAGARRRDEGDRPDDFRSEGRGRRGHDDPPLRRRREGDVGVAERTERIAPPDPADVTFDDDPDVDDGSASRRRRRRR